MNGFMRNLAAGGMALAALTGTAFAEDVGSVEKGHRFAQKVCAACHGVEKGYQPSKEPFAPTFEAIAKTPGMTQTALSIFLHTPHSTMPNLVLNDDELADVIAYITSLKD